jgi:hypothetical protein
VDVVGRGRGGKRRLCEKFARKTSACCRRMRLSASFLFSGKRLFCFSSSLPIILTFYVSFFSLSSFSLFSAFLCFLCVKKTVVNRVTGLGEILPFEIYPKWVDTKL